MKIVLSGVETNNKGAELMLYAILQEIERRFPGAEVYIPYFRLRQGLGYVKTSLDLKYTPFSKQVHKWYLKVIFYKLHLPMRNLNLTNIVRGADWFLDGSGFAFSDQWHLHDDDVKMWNDMLSTLRSDGCKIIFLPQAFGPLEDNNTRKAIAVLNNFASVLMTREKVSYDYVVKSGLVNINKIKMYPDFTSLVKGVFPIQYDKFRGGVCIIPNMKMIIKNIISYEDYVEFVSLVIKKCKSLHRPVYLLNHGGNEDEELAYRCSNSIGGDVEVVTGLNALEVKGLIETAYAVITSRFHGLASALNSGVPALATSWSHKYEELFKDFNMSAGILPVNNIEETIRMVDAFLDEVNIASVREKIRNRGNAIQAKNKEMWDFIWNLKE